VPSFDAGATPRRSTSSLGPVITLRRLSLALVILGATLISTELPPQVDSQPLPGPALKVRLAVAVRFGGDYYVEVIMPKVGDALGLETETVPCALSFQIVRDGSEILSQHVETITRESEYGWAHTQQYTAGRVFHLSHGTYDVTIAGGPQCPSAVARGASVTVAEQYKEHILGSLLRYLSARLLLVVGVVGLLISEFKGRPNNRFERSRGASSVSQGGSR
jgi:hypothetical protein